MLRQLIFQVIFCYALMLIASNMHGQEQRVAIKVYAETRQQFSFPWAGGMNSCQFGKLDMNLDGLKDLVVFDRAGDRIMPFLQVQSGDSFKYDYAPGYAAYFPVLSHWVIFVDYNLDGKEDIFTYSPGFAGLKVYRNVSENNLEFKLEVFPFLSSFQGGGYVNILVTYADYPAICDLDGDGDLDILTFWGLGSFVEKHRNMSMEKYGHADSLDYEKTDYCWGYFAESEESNDLTLDTCLRCKSMEAWKHGGMDLPTADRHTGSTFCILDLNGDVLPDLLLGDVDYPNLVALYNGGSIDSARMASYDWQFPPDDKAVNLFSLPAAFYDDYNFDGVKDLLVSPFDPNPFLTENFQSTWLYQNFGSNDQPQFNLRTETFLQDRMIDLGAGAYPVFCDIDRDGLMDLLIGNYGYYDTSFYDEFQLLHTEQNGKIAYLKNTGSQVNPAFTFINRDFAGVSSLELKGIVPAFDDLDGDGDIDMLLGCEGGQLISYLNTAAPGEPVALVLDDMNYQGIDVGAFSTPVLFDLDKDELKDLIIGEKGGNLNFYRNSGTLQKPSFILVTDSLGKVNVTDFSVSLDGYSVPYFFRDAKNQTQLLVGSEQGDIFFYPGIDDLNFTGAYEQSDTLAGFLGIEDLMTDRGYRTAPALFDLDLDGYPDMIAGNFSGGLEFFGKGAESTVNHILNPSLLNYGIQIYPSPASETLTIACQDCDSIESAQIYLYDSQGKLVFQSVGDLKENIQIKVVSLPVGIYLVRIFIHDKDLINNNIYSARVVIL